MSVILEKIVMSVSGYLCALLYTFKGTFRA